MMDHLMPERSLVGYQKSPSMVMYGTNAKFRNNVDKPALPKPDPTKPWSLRMA